MSSYASPFSLPKQKALAVIPHVSGTLSILGSGWIIMEVLRDKHKRRTVYHRLLLCMSVYDVVSSFWVFLSSWPVPAGTWYGAVGNRGSCTAQGFFLTMGIATPIYNSSLSLYYMLQFKYNWTDRRFAERVEGWVHAGAATAALLVAVPQIPLRLYAPGVMALCTTLYPPDCFVRDEGCELGSVSLHNTFALVFFAVVWWCTIFSAICIVRVYKAVRTVESRAARYKFPRSLRDESSDREMLQKSRQVAKNGMLYMMSYALTWTVPSIVLLLWEIRVKMTKRGHFGLLVAYSILFPLQGAFNWVIYMRPRCMKYAREHPEWTSFRVLRQAFRRPLADPNASDDDYMLGVIDEEEQSFLSGFDLNCPRSSSGDRRISATIDEEE